MTTKPATAEVDTSPEELRSLANCDARAGEPLGKALRAVASEKERWQAREEMLEELVRFLTEQRDKFRAALATARRDALEEAAKVAELEGSTGYQIAAAIRALIDDTGPSIADELAQARGFIKDYQRQLSEEMVRSSVAEAKLAKVQGALDDLAIRLGDPQRRYDKIGPTWTGKSGHEYSDMSELLDFATEIGEQTDAIRALIDREPEPVVDRPAQWPRYELKFIMRVLGHKGVAPREDWETAYGMAKDILLSLPAALTQPASGPRPAPAPDAPSAGRREPGAASADSREPDPA